MSLSLHWLPIIAFAAACLVAASAPAEALPPPRVGEPADVAPSAYMYRADRRADANPPEAWILLMQALGLPYTEPIGPRSPGVGTVFCGLLWEEVRPVRFIELRWSAGAARQPAVSDLTVSALDATDDTAHTWWNPRSLLECASPAISADGLTYTYAVPVDTWGVVVRASGSMPAQEWAVPEVRALIADTWKRARIEIEWGFGKGTLAADYSGSVAGYDAVLGPVRPIAGDTVTRAEGRSAWTSASTSRGVRRGVVLDVLYIGSSRWRKVWPYTAAREDVARSLVTLRTKSGGFTFSVSDLEMGPILAPEYGFFVRTVSGARPERTPRDASTPVPPYRVLGPRVEEPAAVPRIRAWREGDTPWFGVNPDQEAGVAGSLTIPARCSAMHPGSVRDVQASWMSPIRGRVTVEVEARMADWSGGNGVAWSLFLDRSGRRTALAAGVTGTGGRAAWKSSRGIAVQQGDAVSLVLGPNGDHTCDTTVIVLRVQSESQVWALPDDVLDSGLPSNPLPDRYGRPGVWFFGTCEPLPAAPVASSPPFRMASRAKSAAEYIAELSARDLHTIRERTRDHAEQTWDGAVRAMVGDAPLPPTPEPPFLQPMRVETPDQRLTAQWNLGAWHILRHSLQGSDGSWRFNDFPFGILSSETYMILRALDLLGMHKEAADGLDQWLRLATTHRVTPGQNGHHSLALPDRPLGLFSEGNGALTHAEGIEGWGGHMDGVHAMGPGAIVFSIAEHFRLTGNVEWLRANMDRIKANADWILRQRKVLQGCLPGGDRLWSKGLQPAHVVTPDSMSMHMQFYESEAYYWLAVQRTAEMLAVVSPEEGRRMAREAEDYREDLVAAIDRSVLLTPVTAVRDGTYRSFIPFAPYVRGFATGAWGWRRCQGHVGAIYWDTVQSADPLVSPAGLIRPDDPRVQGHLDVLEDRLLLENTKVLTRTPDFDADRDWFGKAGWQYQCGLERHASIHLMADDPACFIRSWLNQYAVDIMPGEYTFREHTTGGPPDKIYEESCFLERFRQTLVYEDGETLWLCRATPRDWLSPGKRIAVANAPTHFGTLSFEVRGGADSIEATIELPTRSPVSEVVLRLRHPERKPIRGVTVNGRPWSRFDARDETVRFGGRPSRLQVVVSY